MGLGVILFGEWLVLLPRIPLLLTENGLLTPWVIDPPSMISWLLEPHSARVMYAVHGVVLVPLIGFITGRYTRISAAVLLLYLFYLWQLSYHAFPTTGHRFDVLLLVLFALQGSGKKMMEVWPLRILQLQVSATYMSSALKKSLLPDWQSGNAILGGLEGRYATPLAQWIATQPIPMHVYDVLTWSVLFLEFFIAVGLWIPELRKIAMITGVVFHLMIALLFGLLWFFVIPLCYLSFVSCRAEARQTHM